MLSVESQLDSMVLLTILLQNLKKGGKYENTKSVAITSSKGKKG